jgi:hypothetical protein
MASASEVILELSIWSRRETTAGSWKATAIAFGSVTGRELESEELRKRFRLLISGVF